MGNIVCGAGEGYGLEGRGKTGRSMTTSSPDCDGIASGCLMLSREIDGWSLLKAVGQRWK